MSKSSPRVFSGLYEPTGMQTLTLANSTSVAVNSTVRTNADRLVISVETQNVRYRDDGTNPTITTGILLTVANSPYVFNGFNRTSTFKFQRSTGSAKVTVAGYRAKGNS